MEDNLFSMSCPNCENSLFEAAIFNPKYLHKAECPFCGQSTRWARFPITMLTSGTILFGISAYCLISKIKIPEMYALLPAIAIGIGGGCFLFGLMYLRFIAISDDKMRSSKSSELIGHVHV